MSILRFYQRLRRSAIFLKLDYLNWVEDRKRNWRQAICQHSFRPVRYDSKPGRWCSLCDKEEPLTPEEFFAQFGERGWQK